MSNLVKQSQLSEVSLDLWNKAKERTNGAFKTATYDESTQTITFTKINDTTIEVPLTDLVSKSNANVITGETLLTDGYVLGGVISKLDNQQNTMTKASLPHYWGYKAARVTTSQTLTHITIAIHNDVPVGTRIDGIKVGAINVNDNRISTYVVENATAYVQENKNTQLTNCTKSVVVTLPQPFTPDQNSWFCITCLNAAWGERTDSSRGDGCSEAGTNGIMPNVGQPVPVKAGGYLGKYLLHSDKVSLNDLVNMANGAVKTVNSQRPDGQGNVTIDIEHIAGLQDELDNKVDKTTDVTNVGGQANADKVVKLGADGKLDVNMIPELAITRVHPVTGKQEAMDLITAGTIQTGDAVVVENQQNAIFMYKGTTNNNFDDDFIQLSIGNGTVKTVNGQTPNSSGAVTITANQINLSTGRVLEIELNGKLNSDRVGNEANKVPELDGNGKLVEQIIPDSIKNKISTINQQAGQDGNINFSLEEAQNSINFKVGSTTFGSIKYMTEADVEEIKALFV